MYPCITGAPGVIKRGLLTVRLEPCTSLVTSDVPETDPVAGHAETFAAEHCGLFFAKLAALLVQTL